MTFPVTFHILGAPLFVAEDTAYSGAGDARSIYPFALAAGTYAGGWRIMRTLGQRPRIWAMIRATSSMLPALASMFAGRNLATKRCRPQNT